MNLCILQIMRNRPQETLPNLYRLRINHIPMVISTMAFSSTSAHISSLSLHPPTVRSFLALSSTHVIFLMTLSPCELVAVVHSTHITPSTGCIAVTVPLSPCTLDTVARSTTILATGIPTSFAMGFAMSHWKSISKMCNQWFNTHCRQKMLQNVFRIRVAE